MRITIVYDNDTRRDDLRADWGFACLVEAHGRCILFDAGAKGHILLGNMEKLGTAPALSTRWSNYETPIRSSHLTNAGIRLHLRA